MKNLSFKIQPIIFFLLLQLLELLPDASSTQSVYAQNIDNFSKTQTSKIKADTTKLFIQNRFDTTNITLKQTTNHSANIDARTIQKITNNISTDIKLEPFDYFHFVSRFHLYNPFYIKDFETYRRDVIHHDRNLQHYKNNLFLIRESEFNEIVNNTNYLLTKQGLVMTNYLLTEGLNPQRFGESRYLMLKSKNKLILNNALNLLQKVIGSQNVENRPGWIALDIHVHTYQSFDGTSNIETLLLTANKKGFGAIAITDHDYFDDAHLALRTAARLKREGRLPENFVVIPGMEISTRDGHILGLFLKSYIPHGLSAEQTIAVIHSQGGLAIAPHPFQQDFGVGAKLVKTLPFDGMVVTGFGLEFQLAMELSEEVKNRMAIFMDSDTHVENGLAWVGYTLVQTENHTSEGIYEAIKQKKTQPVHRNIVQLQKQLFSKKPAKLVVRNINQLTGLKFRIESELARLIWAKRIRIHGLVPDVINDFAYFYLFDPSDTHFMGRNIFNRYFIRGFTAYYGPLYFNVQKNARNFDANLGLKLFW